MSLCQPEPEQQQCQSRAAVTELSIKCGYINNPTEKSIHVCPSHLIVWVESSDNKPVHTFITRWWKGLCNGRKHKIKCMPQQQHAAACSSSSNSHIIIIVFGCSQKYAKILRNYYCDFYNVAHTHPKTKFW